MPELHKDRIFQMNKESVRGRIRQVNKLVTTNDCKRRQETHRISDLNNWK